MYNGYDLRGLKSIRYWPHSGSSSGSSSRRHQSVTDVCLPSNCFCNMPNGPNSSNVCCRCLFLMFLLKSSNNHSHLITKDGTFTQGNHASILSSSTSAISYFGDRFVATASVAFLLTGALALLTSQMQFSKSLRMVGEITSVICDTKLG